ncbi:MAG: hypothetical protein JSV38_00255 [Desulfobacterales bacterium]|nr:MAG: hypothetical protein JSV38_00255 [Desulfobacterales bacterium]
MKRITHAILLGVVVGILAWPATVLADKPVITVFTVEELYSAVNDEGNMNVTVHLVAGPYILNDSYPNGGRLVLQPGMDLVGENEYNDLDGDGVWDPLNGERPTPSSDFVVPVTETIIDGMEISLDDQGDLIVVGHDNLVQKLTIKNMPYEGYALIGSSANGYPQVGWKLRVIDCLLENDSSIGLAEMGVDCVNRGSELDGANTKCTFTGNIVRNLPNIESAPDGFRIRNDGSNNAKIHVTLRGNRAYSIPGRTNPPAEGHGLALYGTYFAGGNNNDVRTVSIGNVFSECGVGLVVMGSFPLFTISSGNRVSVTSNNDQIINNYTQGGVIITAAFPIGGDAFDNEAVVKMLGTSFISDDGQPENLNRFGLRQDLVALGAVPYLGFEEPIDNKASLLLRGATSDNGDPSFAIGISDPDNEMKLIGSETAVERANEGVDLIFF